MPLNIFDKCSEDDPALLLDWDDDAIALLLNFFLRNPNNRSGWFAQGNDTIQALKESIIAFVRRINNGADMESHGTAIIARLTLGQYSQVQGKITLLCSDPQVVAAYRANAGWGPIAQVCAIADGSKPIRPIPGDVVPHVVGRANFVQLFH